MAAFAAKRAGWQVKKLDAAPAGLSPRGGATICSTSVGLIIFGGKCLCSLVLPSIQGLFNQANLIYQ